MKEIKIKLNQLNFIKANIEESIIIKKLDESIKRGPKILRNHENSCYLLLLNIREREILLDFLTNLFSNIGLMDNDEPNETGLFIEDIIDLIY